MLIIGLDYHPSFQQIAFINNETGEFGERLLLHKNGEAESFYRELKLQGVEVRIGMEATGHARWFERLIAELGFELWIGDPAQIRAKRVRKQKTDREDARLLLTPVTLLPISFTAVVSSGSRRPVMNTCAPSSTNRLAVANPVPLVPPVTSPIFPSSLPIFIFLHVSRASRALCSLCSERYRLLRKIYAQRDSRRAYLLFGPESASYST